MAWVLRVRKSYSSNSEINVDIPAGADMEAIKRAVTQKAKDSWDGGEDVARELAFTMSTHDETIARGYTGFAVVLLREKRRRQPAAGVSEPLLNSEVEEDATGQNAESAETPGRKRGKLEIGALGVYKQLARFIVNFFNAVGEEDRVRVRSEALDALSDAVGADRITSFFACNSQEEALLAADEEFPDEAFQILALQAAQNRQLQIQIQDTKAQLERKLDALPNVIIRAMRGGMERLGEEEDHLVQEDDYMGEEEEHLGGEEEHPEEEDVQLLPMTGHF